MKFHLLLILYVLGFCFSVYSQENQKSHIDGKIINSINNEPVAFANIINYSTNKGTISNMDGYFKIGINSLKDSIVVTFIGFKNNTPVLQENKFTYTILLQEQTHQLGEITIRPGGNNYLYTLLENCRKSAKKRQVQAKAYYELKSYNNEKQVELIEGFYNVKIETYDLTELNIKAARLALQPINNRYFVSVESSKAISMLRLINDNMRFPKNPLEYPMKDMKRIFDLSYENSYTNEIGDSIYVILYTPKIEPERYFTGKIWVNASKKFVEKIDHTCLNTVVHPFLPLFKSDRIERVDLNISKSFTRINGKTFFNHIDFDYKIDYTSRVGTEQESTYSVSTNAVVHAYDYNELFYLPKYPFDSSNYQDYVKIRAMPYNEYFWEKNDEFRLNNESDENELFYNSPLSQRNNVVKLSPDTISLSKFNLGEFIPWSEKRIWFKNATKQAGAPNRTSKADIISEQYNLSAKLYLDVNQYGDKPHYFTRAVLDTYNSYYKLPMDNATQCFINMFFDLAEMERRQLEMKLAVCNGNREQIELLYEKAVENLTQTERAFQRDVQRGTMQRGMEKWNKYIYNALGIDNLSLFNPFEE
jgi:hypothetical protein